MKRAGVVIGILLIAAAALKWVVPALLQRLTGHVDPGVGAFAGCLLLIALLGGAAALAHYRIWPVDE